MLLASHIDRDAALAELQRFEGAEYVWGNLSLDRLAEVNQALSPDPTATPPDPTPPS